jgi:hypothetical protein
MIRQSIVLKSDECRIKSGHDDVSCARRWRDRALFSMTPIIAQQAFPMHDTARDTEYGVTPTEVMFSRWQREHEPLKVG